MSEQSKAMAAVLGQLALGKTKQQIANQIGLSRATVSLYVAGKYNGNVAAVEKAILDVYSRRVCPVDAQEKTPEHCKRLAFRPRPFGFPDAEAQWLACQGCEHKPTREVK